MQLTKDQMKVVVVQYYEQLDSYTAESMKEIKSKMGTLKQTIQVVYEELISALITNEEGVIGSLELPWAEMGFIDPAGQNGDSNNEDIDEDEQAEESAAMNILLEQQRALNCED
mmetsp:Transcript_16138/g.20899  ORF Transcript_16138/g.20899 Transcript_16138/m.20899 type:complete len:114 (+) Transcript_16138:540-881(+)